jgi:hypothetical protein
MVNTSGLVKVSFIYGQRKILAVKAGTPIPFYLVFCSSFVEVS